MLSTSGLFSVVSISDEAGPYLLGRVRIELANRLSIELSAWSAWSSLWILLDR
jgi:hypothetical protein